jgi:hypothetical protein
VLRAGQEDVYPVLGAQEAHFAGRVAAYERDDDDLGFFALEVVDRRQTQGLERLFPEETMTVAAA